MEELSYLLISPYTILKSRTGGVLARLLARIELELVGAQMLLPDKELVDAYADLTFRSMQEKDKKSAELIRDYIIDQFSPTENGPRRTMFLLFRGENPCEKLYSVVGKISAGGKVRDSKITGETIRDTYADLVYDTYGNLRYFEPAVLTPQTKVLLNEKLMIFAKAAFRGANLIENLKYDDTEDIERTLVLIKPDNWRYPSAKPGNIIDMFSRTGLRIIACKIYQMSVADALTFYGPVKNALRSKLAPKIGTNARELLEKELNIKLPNSLDKNFTEMVGTPYADDQFNQIIEFMSGFKPTACLETDTNKPGIVKSMALVYEGKNAVRRIREVLGPTDPTKAPSGTIRKEFGKDIMVNTAHASDSPENAIREMGIIKIQENPTAKIILDLLDKS